MKKIFIALVACLLLVGCSLGTSIDNTPTKKVEKYLNNYQTLSQEVLLELDTIVDQETDFSEEQKNAYKDILKTHYQDLVYQVKDETVNGDKATVEVEIEVRDNTKVLKNAEIYKSTNKEQFSDESEFIDYKLEVLKNNKEKVKYTIYFSLTKLDNYWSLDDLTESEQEKILGIYEY